MQVDDLPLMSMLKDRMSWLNKRQDLLAQNVASNDVSGYTPRDLKPMDFEKTLKSAVSASGSTSSLAITNAHHITGTINRSGYDEVEKRDTETTPSGNSVSLEQEMMKVAETQAQYQVASNVYAKAIGMMKTAIGRGGS